MRRTSEVAWFSFSRLTKYADRQLSLAVVALAPTLLAFRNDLSRVRIEIIQSFVTYRFKRCRLACRRDSSVAVAAFLG
jgi:hypothetical protein